jgi:ABC-type transporter Mla MlaB component
LSVTAGAAGALALRGAISFGNAAEALRAAPQPARGTRIEVDLSELTGADSASLAVLIAWAAQARTRGAELRYLHAPTGLRNLARLSDVEALLGLDA